MVTTRENNVYIVEIRRNHFYVTYITLQNSSEDTAQCYADALCKTRIPTECTVYNTHYDTLYTVDNL